MDASWDFVAVESILLPKEGHLSVFEVAERQNTACEIARLEKFNGISVKMV